MTTAPTEAAASEPEVLTAPDPAEVLRGIGNAVPRRMAAAAIRAVQEAA